MNKPDDRRDNAEKIKKNIQATKRNMEAANDMLERGVNGKAKADLEEKNQRRVEAIPGMEREMEEESNDR
jgi:small acid-soluble spore protein (thioredoxin-like protein)